VEKLICTHPGVLDVAIVGLPHEIWGEAVTAFIVPRDLDDPPSEEEVIAFCRDKIAGYKRPKAVHVLAPEEMPRTGSGKVLHRVLRERYWGATVR
jgi:fatty-acyl-CoA synthase